MSSYPNQAALPGPWGGQAYHNQWGGQRYPLPAPLPTESFVMARPHMYPRFADRFFAFFRTPMVQAMISPMMAVSSYSKSPAGGMGVLEQERQASAMLRQGGFQQHTGINPRDWAPENVVPQNMPPVSRPRVRSGAGVVPYWSIGFRPRSEPPEAVVATIQSFRNTLHRAERGSAHTQLAVANRQTIIRRAFGG